MNTTTTKLHPTTKINLRASRCNWESNETSRVPMDAIMSPGANTWEAAFAYLKSIDSSQAFKIDSHVVKDKDGNESLEWWLRTFRDPEEGSVRPDNEDLNEEIYLQERGM